MRAIAYFILISALPSFALAQQNSEEELKNKIKVLETTVKEERDKNAYLLDALNIRKQGQEVTTEDITIRVTEVYGIQSEGTIYIKGLITYKGTTKKSLQFSTQELVDPNGLQYTAYTGLQPATMKDFRVAEASADVPYAFLIKFEGIQGKPPISSLLRLSLFGQGVRGTVFDFKGVDISWRNTDK